MIMRDNLPSFRIARRVPSLVIGALVALGLCLSVSIPATHAADAGDEYARWAARRDALAKDPTVLRLYTFAENSGDTVRNLVGKDGWGDMTIATNPFYIESHPLRTAEDVPTWTRGRWPQKGALTFGAFPKSVYRSHFYAARENRFTALLWVRLHREPGEKTSTELCYVEDTITSGWKLTSSHAFTVFQISRPPGKDPGQGSVAVYGPALSPYIWHQVGAVLDGNAIHLYIDGKLAKSKEFDGIYTQPKVSDLFAKRPELDTAGLVLGNRTAIARDSAQPNPEPLFDMDEFVLFDRVLSTDEIAHDFAAGNPGETPDIQLTQYKEYSSREAALNAIVFSIPTSSFGYFTVKKPFLSSIVAPAAEEIKGPLDAAFTLKEYSVADPREAVVSTTKKTIAAGKNVDVPIMLPQCGLYSLDVTVRDAAGVFLRGKRFPVAGIVELPPTSTIPLTSPLAGHDIVNSHPAEIMLGGRFDRGIAPFLRILPDGSYDWSIPDARVAADLKNGFEPLYTIYPPHNMPKNSPQELAKDPDRWAAWVKDLVTHFKGKVHYWEIWNEPNAVDGLSATDYVVLLKTAYAAIQEVDPTAKVVGGSGVYFITQWTEGVLAAGGGPYMDILSVHNYVGTSPILYRNRYHKLEQVQELLKKYIGHPIPVWNSEGGIHQPARVGGRPLIDDQMMKMYGTRANKDDGWAVAGVHAIMMTTEHRSACWNVQSILIDLADGVEKYFTLMGAGTFYPFKTSSEGLPTEKGISYAALASVLSPSKSVQWIPLSNSRAMATLVTDRSNRRTAVLFSDQPLEFTFNAGAEQTFTGMDFLGNPLQWKANDGSLTLQTGDEPIYVFNVPAGFSERRLLSTDQFPRYVAPRQLVEGTLSVANPGKNPLAATLEASSAAGRVFLAGSVVAPPRGTFQVPFRFEADDKSRGPKTLHIAMKSDGKTISQLEIPFYAEGPATMIPLINAPMPLDGQAESWAAIKPQVVNQPANVVIGKPDVGVEIKNAWQGPNDCSFTVKTAWRRTDGIYVRIDVTDDAFHPTPAGNTQPWLWDGLELFVDTRLLEKRTASVSTGAQQIMVVPAKAANSSPCIVNNLAGKNATVDVIFTGQATERGYLLEGKISPKPGSVWELKPGTRLGLDFAIDDNDDSVRRKSQLVLHGTATNAADTSRWGEYQLAD
jgi:hypothetical protein